MNADVFKNKVLAELYKSPDVPRDSFFAAKVQALGREFERGAIGPKEAVEAIERLLPWQINRDIKKSVEKALR